MITRPTVLVLGAGASVPYGFPTGEGLVRQILKDRKPDLGYRGIEQQLMHLGCNKLTIDSFYESLRRSRTPSIDVFLEQNPKYMRVGKLAIAIALISHEREHVLFQTDFREGEWYSILINAIRCSPDSLCQNRLTVVNFNYDRSLLHAITQSLIGFYDMSQVAAVDAVQQIRIIHPYGSLGELPGFGGPHRPYSAESNLEQIELAADGIKLFPEGEKHENGFADAKRAIKAAERVCFLGFGYHETNMQRLGRDEWGGVYEDRHKFWGTIYQLEAQELQAVRKAMGNASLNPAGADTEADARLFLRRHFALV